MTERLPHGYTNATRIDGAHVIKRYLGPDGMDRRNREVAALRGLAHSLPVPPVVEVEDDSVVLGWVRGLPGQELLGLDPDRVLQAVGVMARRLHRLPPELVPGLDGEGVLVHGDFGPHNMLFDPDSYVVTAVLDWELVRRGTGVDDLAWAEWIVRTHHSELTAHLPALYAGYGAEPTWAQRRAAMLRTCDWALDFTTRWGGADSPGAQLWRDRIAVTAAFRR